MFNSQTISAFGLAVLAMAPSVRSHMIMASPKPFGSPNNSPLDPSGSDYPCKMTGGTAGPGPMNEFAVGSDQQLSFTGSAVHGGGSCQLAVTTDKNPTKDSKFKVIHSIEGGCPGVSGPSTFQFKVPDSLPNGEAVFAWTWFNHIGNREMYMNCANIKISGGSDDTSKFDALPDMALANINVGTGASCKTPEGSDYTFANAGDSVEKVGSGPFVDLCGGASTGGGSTGGGSGNSGAAPAEPAPGAGSGAPAGNNGQYTPGAGEGGAQETPAAPQQPEASAPAAPADPAPTPSAAPVPSQPADNVTSTVRTLVTVTAPSASATPPAEAPAASAPAAAPAQPSGAPAAPGNSTGGSGSGTCTADGQVVCNGDSQFGLCNNGQVVWQAVAPGTACTNGKIAKRHFRHRAHRRSSF